MRNAKAENNTKKEQYMKILYIGRETGTEDNGAGTVMKRNFMALETIVGKDNLFKYLLPQSTLSNVLSSMMTLGSYGVPRNVELDITSKAMRFKPDAIFIDSTSYGSLAKRLSSIAPIISFAHNLDTELARQEIKSRPFWISFPKYLITKYNEWKTTNFANYLICLNRRDSDGFQKLFGRKADAILPITFPVKDISPYSQFDAPDTPYYLFVGSDFFPNVEGIIWFILNVAPYIDIDFHIVGSCCHNEAFKRVKNPKNVKIRGYVDNLDNEYYFAAGVIAPIFKGSGMKTKTIEALSYGKSIFGTDEAFAGIDANFDSIGARCNTSSDFIKALKLALHRPYNEYSYNYFLNNLSTEVFVSKLSQFLESHIICL